VASHMVTDGGRRARPRVEWTRWLWVGFVVVGGLAIVGYHQIPDKGTRDVAYVLIGLFGVSGIVVGLRIHRPRLWLPWCLMAAGQLLWIGGDVVFVWYENVLHIDPFPSWADAFYVAGYPVIALGLYLFIRGRRPRGDVGGTLDAATVTAGLGLLSWVTLAQPTINSSQESLLTAAVAAAYPVADIVLVAALVRLLTLPGGGWGSLRLLLIALALLVAGDTLFLALGLFGAGESYPIDFLWLASYLAWGAAALHPSMVPLSLPAPETPVGFRRARLVVMTLATLIAPGVLGAERFAQLRLDVVAVTVGSVLLFLLVVGRMWLAIREIGASNAALQRLQEELAFQAAHDPLTDLPNRAEAMRLIHAGLSRARRSGDLLALVFVDLDGFKKVNDTCGHRGGDLVLRVVAQRLLSELRAGDVVARLGGDEFVVLLEPIDTEASAVDVAERLITAISRPIPLAPGEEVQVGASIGMVYNQDAGTDAETLLHEADVAVYRAKAHGRGRVEVFSEALGAELTSRAELQTGLGDALACDQLLLFYQPIVRVATGAVEGYEALVRWERPGVGWVPPTEFIPIAERSDLICDLDVWALGRAAAQLEAWNRTLGLRDLAVCVNISGRHVQDPRIRDDVAAVLRDHDIDPRQLVLEITETVLVDGQLAIENLRQLRRLGVALSLDDFGTGYNSLTQLSRLPVDRVKIDRTYLDTGTPQTRTLLQLMVQVAHAFGHSVVGEGVEHQEQLEVLGELGVESAQGFLLGRPLPADQIEPRRLAAARPG